MVLGGVLMAIKGYATPEVGNASTRALELCRQVGQTPQLLFVIAGLVGFNMLRGEVHKAHELAEEFLRLAQTVQPALQPGHQQMGDVWVFLANCLRPEHILSEQSPFTTTRRSAYWRPSVTLE